MMIYIEVNAICLAILGIMLLNSFRQHFFSVKGRQFNRMVWATVLLCVSDMVAGICRGATFPGARSVLWVSNMLYQLAPPLAGSFWMLYALQVLYGRVPAAVRKILLILFTLFSLLVLLSPASGMFFTLDEQNLYHRGHMLWLLWIYSYILVILPSVLALFRRKECQNWGIVASYAIAPALCCLAQILFYGITTAQAGIIVSLFMLYVLLQGNEVTEARMREQMLDELSRTDALTGLPNRRAYEHALGLIPDDTMVGVIFCDLNNLKYTNDTLGHGAGDKLIFDFAELLRRHVPDGKAFRISGDEFVCLICDWDEAAFRQLCDALRADLGTGTEQIAAMGCDFAAATSGVLKLVASAEKQMYQDKAAYYRQTGRDRHRGRES